MTLANSGAQSPSILWPVLGSIKMTASFIHFEGGGGHRARAAGSFLRHPYCDDGREMPGQANLETILRTGQIVAGQYRVDGLIAKGGMAAVWAGVNEHTGKRVALKVILKSFSANAEAVELFRREALTASKVNHPNVVNIFDVIDHEGMTCIVMELPSKAARIHALCPRPDNPDLCR
jgi:serine/threonine protein kinase